MSEAGLDRGSTGATDRPDVSVANPELVGARLRAHRERTGMGLRALAREVGVSPSLISQIENGKVNPSVGTLFALVSALGVSLDELFFDAARADDTGEAGAPAQAPTGAGTGPASNGPVLRARNRPTLGLATGVRWERLTPTPDPEVDFLYVTYEVGGASCPPDALMRHAGREYGLVLQGRLGATVGFESYELEVGDSIVYDAMTPHRFWTIGDEPSVVVWTTITDADDPTTDASSHPDE
jgi:DNA-binding XRE family transcriptional regulator/mannose-6-phosphate isomerase-like protein (cupin superfamily)